jgi:hypothetical protein
MSFVGGRHKRQILVKKIVVVIKTFIWIRNHQSGFSESRSKTLDPDLRKARIRIPGFLLIWICSSGYTVFFTTGGMGYEPSNLSPWGITLFRGDYGRMLGYLRGLEVGFLKNHFSILVEI